MVKTSFATVLRLGITYFAIVFCAGFVLGAIRVFIFVPSLGMRTAELLEMPIMLFVMIFAARFVTKHIGNSRRGITSLGIGFLALALLLSAEIGLTLLIQQQSLGEFVTSRDPVSGVVYLVMLVIFAILPFILARKRNL